MIINICIFETVEDGFDRAAKEIAANPSRIALWQPIIAKYHPTFIGECEKAIKWSEEIAREWLVSGMFKGRKDARRCAARVVEDLGDHALQKSHARHISQDRAKSIGLVVEAMEELNPQSKEESQKLQDAILSVHHSCIITLMRTDAYKVIENHNGVAQILAAHQQRPA